MSEINLNKADNISRGSTIYECWIKPPLIVNYSNSKLISHEGDLLVCDFLFPKKYYENDFYVNGQKVLNKYEMYRGRRYFYSDRFYSLLEFFSDKGELKALYFDITLPAIIKEDSVIITDIKLDIFYLIDERKYFLLDEDEYEEAIRNNIYSQEEIDVCNETTAFIRDCILSDKIEDIFLNYRKSSPDKWDRYAKTDLS